MENEDLGPWNGTHEARFLDLTSKEMCKRIKYFYRRNHLCESEQISDCTTRDTTWYLQVHHCDCFSMNDILQPYPHPLSRKNIPVHRLEIDRLEAGCEMIDNRLNAVWYDEDGQKVVHYFPHFLNPRLETEVTQAFRDLIEQYTPTKPSESEKRSTRYEESKVRLGKNAKSLLPTKLIGSPVLTKEALLPGATTQLMIYTPECTFNTFPHPRCFLFSPI
jgi:hypothetical protein